MNRMNRREFLGVLGGASAFSIAGVNPAFAALDANATTSLYVRGVVMLDLENPAFIRIGFPKTPKHKGKLTIVPQTGTKRTLAITGKGTVEAAGIAPTDPKIFVPELVRMKEFYGDSVRSRVDKCPTVISIPSNAIRSMTTTEVTKFRWTFVRADNNEEVNSFRPRQIAETIKIDLSSAGTLKLNGGKVNIPLETARELHLEHSPDLVDRTDLGYPDHFAHYLPYIERPAALDFDVVPRRLGGNSAPTPKVGHHFMMVDDYAMCAPIGFP